MVGNALDNRSVAERHLQSIALAVLVAFAGWNVSEVNSLRKDFTQLQLKVVVLQTKVENLQDQFKIAMSDRFTATDWRVEKSELSRRLEALEEWMRNYQNVGKAR